MKIEKIKEPQMTKEIEESCWAFAEETNSWDKTRRFLGDLGFSEDDIDLMIERWQEGKSLYPYCS